ncbi:hypothetical protein REPUB_Repub08aG0012700 [Reevesia pubescens]
MEWAGEEEGRMIKAEPESHIQTSVIGTQHCFQSLGNLFIFQCSKLRDITWLILAPNLSVLGVTECELKSIYWDALPFSCLKKIQVVECPKLKRLPLNSNGAKENKIGIEGREEWWKELEWEDESTLNAFLPRFERIG